MGYPATINTVDDVFVIRIYDYDYINLVNPG